VARATAVGGMMIDLNDLANGVALDSLTLTDGDLAALILRLAAAQARIAAILSDRRSQGEDHLLSADQAARILNVDKQWLYRRSSRLPFALHLDGQLRFSAEAIQRYLKARSG
jgi:hypothetical protein